MLTAKMGAMVFNKNREVMSYSRLLQFLHGLQFKRSQYGVIFTLLRVIDTRK